MMEATFTLRLPSRRGSEAGTLRVYPEMLSDLDPREAERQLRANFGPANLDGGRLLEFVVNQQPPRGHTEHQLAHAFDEVMEEFPGADQNLVSELIAEGRSRSEIRQLLESTRSLRHRPRMGDHRERGGRPDSPRYPSRRWAEGMRSQRRRRRRRSPSPSPSWRSRSPSWDSNDDYSSDYRSEERDVSRSPSPAPLSAEQLSENPTPFFMAVQSGDRLTFERCLELRPDLVSATNNHDRSPLYLAALNGHLDLVRLLLDEHFWPEEEVIQATMCTFNLRIVAMLKKYKQERASDWKREKAMRFAVVRDAFSHRELGKSSSPISWITYSYAFGHQDFRSLKSVEAAMKEIQQN